MIFKDQSMPYQSLQGFKCLIWGEKRVILKYLIDGFGITQQEHEFVKLLDTFMSDSFILEMLIDLIEMPERNKPEIEILMLNPFSKFAEVRAKALAIPSIIEQINKTLSYCRRAIYKKKGMFSHEHEVEFENNRGEIDFMYKQLEDIRKFETECKLKIRFYELLTETPIYLISPFVLKGFTLYNTSSVDNPWMIFVNDPSEDHDLYNRFKNNFDAIWKVSKDIPIQEEKVHDNTKCFLTSAYEKGRIRKTIKPNQVFVSFNENKLVKFQITDFIKDTLGMIPNILKRETQNEFGVSDKVKKAINTCSYAIIILTKEDERIIGEVRMRNDFEPVLVYCQSKIPKDKIILLAENGIKLPPKLNGIQLVSFDSNNIEDCFEVLRTRVNQASNNQKEDDRDIS